MKRKIGFTALVLVALVLLPRGARAEAGPPLLTDDPWTPGSNHWEINLAVTSEVNHDEFRLEAPLADINYGVGEHIQLKYEVPFTVSGGTAQASQSGFAQSIAGVKWRFLDKDKTGLAMSTYPQVSFKSPGSVISKAATDSNESGLEFLVPVELEEGLGVFKFNEELGYHVIQGAASHYAYGFGSAYSVRDGFLVMAEFHGESSTSFSENSVISNLGTVFDFSGRLSLLVSVGRTVISTDGGPAKYLSYSGLQFRL